MQIILVELFYSCFDNEDDDDGDDEGDEGDDEGDDVFVIKPGDLSVLPLSDFAPLWLVMPVPVCLSL